MDFRAAVIAGLIFAVPAMSQTVTDGDTIKLNGTTYRLWGIDAPEGKQLCDGGWPAGRVATTFIRELVSGHTVECEARGTDRYSRTIGLCRADGVDIQAAMVKAGTAWRSSDTASITLSKRQPLELHGWGPGRTPVGSRGSGGRSRWRGAEGGKAVPQR